MAVTASVQEFLRRANVGYMVIPHERAYTAQQDAASIGMPRRDWAKAVICFADDAPIQAVVPADLSVNLDRLLRVVGAATIRLAREDELAWLFPDCEKGAMPPLGPLYRQQVFVDETLAAEERIVFNAGTHQDAVCMRYDDFSALTHATVGEFAK